MPQLHSTQLNHFGPLFLFLSCLYFNGQWPSHRLVHLSLSFLPVSRSVSLQSTKIGTPTALPVVIVRTYLAIIHFTSKMDCHTAKGVSRHTHKHTDTHFIASVATQTQTQIHWVSFVTFLTYDFLLFLFPPVHWMSIRLLFLLDILLLTHKHTYRLVRTFHNQVHRLWLPNCGR